MSILNIVKTDTLVVQYVKLPVSDLYFPFLCRTVAPVETVWVPFEVSLIEAIPAHKLNELDDAMLQIIESKVLQYWKSCLPSQEELTEEERASIQWVYDIEKVQLIECEIVPKEK